MGCFDPLFDNTPLIIQLCMHVFIDSSLDSEALGGTFGLVGQ